MIGTVKWFNAEKGFGFISPEFGDAEAFVHVSQVIAAGLDTLRDGDRIEYTEENGRRGLRAVNLRLA